jgi:hypothetical protein
VTLNATSVADKAGLGRRIAAGAIDLFHLCYVALLPAIALGGLAIWREASFIGGEFSRTRVDPKGQWYTDPKREADLEKNRAQLAEQIFGDAGQEAQTFLNGLAPLLDSDTKFKEHLDKIIAHPYTDLASKTVHLGLGALSRHTKTPEGQKGLEKLKAGLKEALRRRVVSYARSEADYRFEQIARYLGWKHLWMKFKEWTRGEALAKVPDVGVSEALHWTHFIDQVASGRVALAAETRANVGLLRWAWLGAGIFAFLFLSVRDVLGRDGSPGKHHAGIEVVDRKTGGVASARQRLTRGVVMAALAPIELVLALLDARLGDRLAGTRVVTKRGNA